MQNQKNEQEVSTRKRTVLMKETRKDKCLKYMKLNIALVFFSQLALVLFYLFFLQIYDGFLASIAGVTMGVCIQIYICYLRKDTQEERVEKVLINESRKAKYLKYMKSSIALVFFSQLALVLFHIFFYHICDAFLYVVAGVTMGVCIQVYVCYLRKDKQEDKDASC